MNRTIITAVCALAGVCSLSVFGQAVDQAALGRLVPTGAKASEPKLIEAGPNHSQFEWKHLFTNSSGRADWVTSRYYQLESGLNVWQPPSKPGDDGQWVPAVAEFSLTPDGAVATKGQFKVQISGTITGQKPLVVEFPDGRTMTTRILGLGYYSPADNRSVLIAELKDCQGELLPNKSQIVFRKAFSGIDCSVRFTISKGGFETDIIVQQQMPSPEEFGLPANSKLEVLTEVLEAPVPRKETQQLDDGTVNEDLDWGGVKMPRGRTFQAGKESDSQLGQKQYLKLEGRQFLIEQIGYDKIEPQLRSLPPQAALDDATGPLQPMRRKASQGRVLPMRRADAKPRGGIKMASVARADAGYVLDWQVLVSQTNFTFAGGATYYVTGTVTLTGTTILESCCVKFTNGASITFNGPVTCLSSAYCPASFVGKDDWSLGEYIPGSNGKPTNYYASTALVFNGATPVVLQNIKIANAQTAITLNSGSGHVLSHVQIGNCVGGINATGADYALRNALFWNVQNNFTGSSSTGHVEHLTTDGATWLNNGQTLWLTNSLLVAVTNYGSYNSTASYLSSSPGTTFQTVKGGAHYLSTQSSLRGLGVTNINPDLLASLKTMTTYPPILLSNTYSSSLTLSQQIPRNTGAPDIGYSYNALDYIGYIYHAYGSLTLTNGVAIGVQGDGPFSVDGEVNSSGTATALNRIVRYSYVQELSSNYWGSCFLYPGPSPCRFRFTDFSIPNAIAYNGLTNRWCPELTFRDCQFRGSSVDLAQVSSEVSGGVNLNNNLIERSGIYVTTNYYYQSTPYAFNLRNNLFRNAGLVLIPRYYVNVQDNLFDGISPAIYTGLGWPLFSNNGFTSATADTLNGNNDITGLTADYQIGPLGRYYYPTSGTGLYRLKNAGSHAATDYGLYHYTTLISQEKEGTTTVDPGFHYVACDGSGKPMDFDGDSIFDYQENPTGDGNPASDRFNWCSSTTHTGLNDAEAWVQGRNPRVNGTVTDSGNQLRMNVFTPLK